MIGRSYTFRCLQFLRFLAIGPPPLFSNVSLFSHLLKSNSLLRKSLQQYVSLHKYNIWVLLNTFMSNPGSLLSCFCVQRSMCGDRNCFKCLQRTNLYRLYYVTISTLAISRIQSYTSFPPGLNTVILFLLKSPHSFPCCNFLSQLY